MQHVYPKLADFCREKHGLEFQVASNQTLCIFFAWMYEVLFLLGFHFLMAELCLETCYI